MTITLNGKTKKLEQELTLSALLKQLGLSGKPVVIEHNKEAIFPRDYEHTLIQDQHQLEIINIAAGG